jgi:hypothetical protein
VTTTVVNFLGRVLENPKTSYRIADFECLPDELELEIERILTTLRDRRNSMIEVDNLAPGVLASRPCTRGGVS